MLFQILFFCISLGSFAGLFTIIKKFALVEISVVTSGDTFLSLFCIFKGVQLCFSNTAFGLNLFYLIFPPHAILKLLLIKDYAQGYWLGRLIDSIYMANQFQNKIRGGGGD